MSFNINDFLVSGVLPTEEQIYGEPMICEFCGSDDNVAEDIDPYEYEINGDDTLHLICEYCYNIFADDI